MARKPTLSRPDRLTLRAQPFSSNRDGTPVLRAGDHHGSAIRRAVAAVSSSIPLAAVLAAGFGLRLLLLTNTVSMPLRIVDEQHYAQLATSLSHGRGFTWDTGELTSIRPPMYPLFIATVWRVVGYESIQAVRTAQLVLGLLTVIAVYVLAHRLFDRRTALVSAAVMCFYPSFLFSGILLLTEVLFTLLIVILAIAYEALMNRPGPGRGAFVGAMVGVAALTRSIVSPLPIVLMPLVVASLRGSWKRRATLALCIVTGYLVVVGPWAVRNTLLQRTLTIVDTMGGMNLRMGNYDYTPETRMWDGVSLTGEKSWSHALRETHPESIQLTEGQKAAWAQREALAYMASHLVTTAKRSILKFADFWGLERELAAGFQQRLYQPAPWFAWLATIATALSYPFVIVTAVIGAFTIAPADRRTHLFILTLVALFTAVHSIVFGHSRYHLPLVPFLAMYAAVGCSQAAWRRLLARPRLAAGATLTIALFIAIWCREVLFRDADRLRALLDRLI